MEREFSVASLLNVTSVSHLIHYYIKILIRAPMTLFDDNNIQGQTCGINRVCVKDDIWKYSIFLN